MVLVICTTSFRVVQLMYSPLRVFETTVGKILCYVYMLSICHYAVHEVSVINGSFI